MKGTHVPEIESILPKRVETLDHSRISNRATAQWQGYDFSFILHNKIVLFVWTYR